MVTKKAGAYIANSSKVKDKLISYGVDEPLIFVSLLTTNSAWYNRNKRYPVNGRILYVGSMVERKGLDLLIAALSHIKSDYEVHIGGNGTNEQIKALKKLDKERHISSKIIWCGYKE